MRLKEICIVPKRHRVPHSTAERCRRKAGPRFDARLMEQLRHFNFESRLTSTLLARIEDLNSLKSICSARLTPGFSWSPCGHQKPKFPPLEIVKFFKVLILFRKMVEPGGVEPPTSCMPCKRSTN
jgi:hypothetical protein